MICNKPVDVYVSCTEGQHSWSVLFITMSCLLEVLYFVFQHIRHISKLSIAIVCNCAVEKPFITYLPLIDWASFLSPWISPSFGSTRLHAKFLCGHVGLSLCYDDLSLLKLEDRDVNSLTRCLASASASENLQGSVFEYSFSASELLTIIQQLIINPDNYQAFAKSSLIPSLLALIVNGSICVKKMVCNLFWCLMDSSFFKDAIKSSELPLDDVFSEESQDRHIKLLNELILVEIHEISDECKLTVEIQCDTVNNFQVTLFSLIPLRVV